MTTTHSTRVATLAGLALLLLGTGLTAQASAGLSPESPVHVRGSEIRMPPDMREGEPVLVGLEQDGNGFRDRTPALQRGHTRSTRVDTDDLYRRRIAMYAGTEIEGAPDRGHAVESAPAAVTTATIPTEGAGLPWIQIALGTLLAAGIGLVLGGVLRSRNRPYGYA